MRDEVLAQPHQIGDALWRVEAAKVPERDAPGGLMICGMGGSAVGADLAAAAIGPRALRPMSTVRGYAPEPWVGPETLVLCASYSGSTEETLACFEAAGAAGAPRVALTTGGPLAERAREEGVPVIGVPSGMQPRAAVIYMTVAALECAAACGAAPSLRAELEGAADTLTALAGDAGEARSIAEALHERLTVVHGAELTAAPARRWRPRSTRTPSPRPSSVSCPRPTTTRSKAGNGRRSTPVWPPCCSPRRACTRGSSPGWS